MKNILETPFQPWVLRSDHGNIERIVSMYSGVLNVVVVDGREMRTKDTFDVIFSDALHLPKYYGRNLNAMRDCLTDENVMDSRGTILVFQNADRLLADESDVMLDGVLDTIETIGYDWSQSIEEGNSWDRPAIPFHVVLETTKKTNRSRLLELPEFSFG